MQYQITIDTTAGLMIYGALIAEIDCTAHVEYDDENFEIISVELENLSGKKTAEKTVTLKKGMLLFQEICNDINGHIEERLNEVRSVCE